MDFLKNLDCFSKAHDEYRVKTNSGAIGKIFLTKKFVFQLIFYIFLSSFLFSVNLGSSNNVIYTTWRNHLFSKDSECFAVFYN
jgi:hypothetical protein